MNLSAETVDASLARLVTTLAAFVALVLAITLPVAYLMSGRASMNAVLEAEAKLASISVTQIALPNPHFRVFENARIRGLLTLPGEAPEPEQRLVFRANGEQVAEQGTTPPKPVMVVAAPIYDSGRILGRVEIGGRSERCS